MKTRLLLLSILWMLSIGLSAQSIQKTMGNYCPNNETIHVLTGASCSSFNWSVSGGTNGVHYTVIGSSNSASFRVRWLQPFTATIACSYICTSGNSTAYTTPFAIQANVTPSVSLSVSPNPVCQASNITLTATPTNGGSPTYYWYVNGAQVGSGTSSTFNYSTASLAAGSHSAYVIMGTTLTCVTATQATSATQSFTVNAKASYTVSLNGPAVICSSSPSATFYANVSNGLGTLTYGWYVNNSFVTNTAVNYYTTSVANGTTVYCRVSSDHPCVNTPTNSDTYTVSLTNSVTPTVSVQIPKLNYCSGETINFTPNSSYIGGGSTYSWRLNGNEFSTQSTTSLPVTTDGGVPNAFSPGDVVTVIVGNLTGSCLTSTSATGTTSGTPIVINPILTPSVSLNVSPTAVCVGNSISLTATPTNGGPSPSYEWFIDGSQVSGSLGTLNYSSAGLAAGSHSVYVRLTTSEMCVSSTTAISATQNFTVAYNPTISNAGPDQVGISTCGLISVTLAGNTPTIGSGSWSVISGSGGSFGNASSPTSSFSGIAGSTYTLRWTISNSPCAASTDDVVITFNRNPTAANAGIDKTGSTTCGLTSVSMTANAPTIGTGTWSIISGSGGSFVSLSSPTSMFNGIAGTTYTLRWTITNSPCTTSTDDVVVTFNRNPTTSNAGLDQTGSTTCGLTSVTLAANAPTVGTGAWSIVSGSGGLLGNASSPTSSFSGIAGATYTLRWTISNSPCTASTDDVVVTFNAIPATPGYTGNSRFGGGPLTISGTGGTNYNWYNASNGFINSGLTFPITMEASAPNYLNVRSVTAAGCLSASVSISINIYPIPVITGPPQVVKGAQVALDGGTGYDLYSWKNAANVEVATTQIYNTSVPDSYTVTVTKNSISKTSAVFVLGSQFSGLNYNYIVTDVALVPVTDPNSLAALPVEKVSQSVSYFDGLGRPIQTVSTQGSVSKTDLVAPVVYDAYGREVRKYLPVVMGNSGRIKEGLIDASGNYTVNTYNNPNDKITDDLLPFSETIFEPSPLNRPDKEYGAGLAWSSAFGGANRFIQHAYLINQHNTVASSTQEKIIVWAINSSGMPLRAGVISGYVVTGGYYASGQLSIKSTKDEEGNEVREYTNKSGQVILKKVQATTAAASNLNDLTGTNAGWALTYYLYDDLGNLRYVMPPELSKLIHAAADTYAVTTTDLDTWAFQYKYDGRKRMSEKKVPGAGWVYMVYDKRDRLVLTQDANQRAGAPNAVKYWTFTKYDELNRPILTGIKDTTSAFPLTQAQMQGVVDAYYNNMGTTTWRKWGESYVGNATNNVHGYSNKSYPVRTGAATEVDPNKYLTVTYYDNYDFRSLWYGTYTYLDENLSEVASYNGHSYGQPDVENLRVIGQVTGTKTKVLDGGVTGGYTWLKGITYYDDKYRMIQTIADNYKGGTDRITNVLDFVGRVLESKLTHTEADVSWKDKVAVSQVGNRLISLNGGWGNSGAASVQTLAAGIDGWLEVVASEQIMYRMVGLSDVNTNANYNTIDYAFYLAINSLQIYENGAQRATISGAYQSGDILRVERSGSSILYKKNGSIVYTSTIPSSSQLLVDVAFNNSSSSLVNIRASFATTTQTITRRFEYDHAGRLLKTWHKLNNDSEILLALNEYNELGQLVDKKLHSTVSNGSNAKQSVDYRYNIRGWLTSMNNAQLANDAITNDDTGDLFGMNLHYNSTELGNSPLYNGNISAMAWSNNQGLGSVKQNGYIYSYDPLNRIKTSVFREKNTSTWSTPANNALQETGFIYDLNGNITQLQRNDKRTTGWMDNLGYTYTGNQLQRVTDTGDDFAGFIDGQPSTSNDYTYDANGNMTRDLNKGIGTSLVDAANIITYNYLNLPESVTKGSNNIRYIYDAGGRKLAQVTTFGGQQKQVDYAGEFQYENDQLQFISHEEGRIAIAASKTIYTHDGASTTGITAVTSTLAQVTQNTYTYVRATASGTTTKQGMFPIGGTITVAAGEQYRIRAKGYRTATNANNVHLYIRTNSTDLNWPGGALANGSTAEAFTEQIITIPAGHTTLQAGVVWNTVANGEQFFLNDFEITKLTTNATPEYQYNLKDHLGNVRLTFTSKNEVETTTATYETANLNAEQSQYVRVNNAKRITSSLFDRTNGVAPTTTPGEAQRLNGSTNERYGIARSLSVMPGDVVHAEVYAKYVDTNSSNWTGALTTLMSQIAANTAGVVVDGVQYGQSTASFPAGFAGLQSTTDNGAPRAYLNWLVFDRNYAFITGGFKQITTAAKEAGTDVAHELIAMPAAITITQPGYMYIYLSNESSTLVEVFFDEFKITHTKSPVIQTDDYYPFGLTFNSYSRENSTLQNYKYNDKELQDELGLNWLDYGVRIYLPDIARWMAIDPAADLMRRHSPYNYTFNNPVMFTDPDGSIPWPVKEKWNGLKRWVSSWFGPRNVKENPNATKNHRGLDINFGGGTDDYGAPVVTTHDGKVVTVKNNTSGNGGRTVTVESPDGKFRTSYFHLSGVEVEAGDEVKEGQTIGEIGSSAFDSETGTASHLHYGIERKNEETGEWEWYNPTEGRGNEEKNIVDPQKWITGKSSDDGGLTEYTNSAPSWAKRNKFFAHIYFIFTGQDSGLPDQLQQGYKEKNGFNANANRPDLVPDTEKRPGHY